MHLACIWPLRKRIVDRDGLRLDRVAHDQQVGVIRAVAAIGYADADVVFDPDIDRHRDRQNNGRAVHFGVVSVSRVRIVEIEVLVRRAVDCVDGYIGCAAITGVERHIGPVYPDADCVVDAAIDVFEIFLGGEHELHRQRVTIGNEGCVKERAVKGALTGDRIQIGVAINASGICRRSRGSIGIGRAVAIRDVRCLAGGQDDPRIRRAQFAQRGRAARVGARGQRVASVGGRDNRNARAEHGVGHGEGRGAGIDTEFTGDWHNISLINGKNKRTHCALCAVDRIVMRPNRGSNWGKAGKIGGADEPKSGISTFRRNTAFPAPKQEIFINFWHLPLPHETVSYMLPHVTSNTCEAGCGAPQQCGEIPAGPRSAGGASTPPAEIMRPSFARGAHGLHILWNQVFTVPEAWLRAS